MTPRPRGLPVDHPLAAIFARSTPQALQSLLDLADVPSMRDLSPSVLRTVGTRCGELWATSFKEPPGNLVVLHGEPEDECAAVSAHCFLVLDAAIAELRRRRPREYGLPARRYDVTHDWLQRAISPLLDLPHFYPEPSESQRLSEAYGWAINSALWLFSEIRTQPPGIIVGLTQNAAWSAFSTLNRQRDSPAGPKWENILARCLLDEVTKWFAELSFEASSLAKKELGIRRAHPQGAFMTLRPAELTPLARREPKMVHRYGEKRIETLFEEQLSLVVQSFGLVVARTSRGRRGVDLICICKSGAAAFCMLIEAKTSQRAYGLPVADQRALRDYVQQAAEGLQTLPPLRILLLVGHAAQPSLPTRLRALEAEAGMPMRFCTTHFLAELRAKLLGPLDGPRFLRLLLESPPIVTSDVADRLAAVEAAVLKAHGELVSTLLR
jgi:hypothetical protein